MRSQKEIRQRAPLWLAGLLITNFVLMSIDGRDEVTGQRLIRVWVQAIVAPFQHVSSGVGGAGVGVFENLRNLRHANGENVALKQQLAEAQTELYQSRAAQDENRRLKQLLDLKESSPYGVVPARVIGRDPSAWFKTVIINHGQMSGIEQNMPVVTRDGIVGRVLTVSPWTAHVMLITDEKAGAGAVVGQLGASNALGVVNGLGRNGLLEMRYVSGLEQINTEDYVVTTGQDRIYPPGLSVGKVVEVKTGSATITHTIYVRPSAQLESLEEVAVLQYHPPQRAENAAPINQQTPASRVEKGRK